LIGLNIKLDQVETLRSGESRKIDGLGTFHTWLEHLLIDGAPHTPLVQKNNITYLAGWPDDTTLETILSSLLNKADVTFKKQEEGVRLQNGFEIDYKNCGFKENKNE